MNIGKDPEDNHLQARKGCLIRNQPCQYLDLEIPASRSRRNKFLLLRPPGVWRFILTASTEPGGLPDTSSLCFLNQDWRSLRPLNHHCPGGVSHLEPEPTDTQVGFPAKRHQLVSMNEGWGGGGAALKVGCSALWLEMGNQNVKCMQIST